MAAATADPVLVVDCEGGLIAPAVSVGLLQRYAVATTSLPIVDCADSSDWSAWSKVFGFETEKGDASKAVEIALSRGLFKGRVLFEKGNGISENLAISVSGVYDLLPDPSGNADGVGSDLPVRFDFRGQGVRNETLPGASVTSSSLGIRWVVDNILADSNRHAFAHRDYNGKSIPFFVMNRIVTVHEDDLVKKCVEYNLSPHWLREEVARASGFVPWLDLTSSSHWDVSRMPLTMLGSAAGAFESTGFCTRNKTMGVSPSSQGVSLGFMAALAKVDSSRWAVSKDRELSQKRAADSNIVYDPSKVYVTHVVSDGDNLNQLERTFNHLRERRELCSKVECAPRTYTIPPRFDIIAPALRAMYEMTNYSGCKDSFMLPPSGARYFYPAAATVPKQLEQLRHATIEAAEMLDIEATVIWDFFFEQGQTHKKYIAGFGKSAIKAVFYSPAPWVLSREKLLPDPFFKTDQLVRDPVTGENTVLFHEFLRWGNPNSDSDTQDGRGFTPEHLAETLSKQKPGSLIFMYDISWSVSTKQFQQYSDILKQKANVELVDHRTLVRLAKEKHKEAEEPLLSEI